MEKRRNRRAWEFRFDNIDAPNNLAFLRELNRICLDNLAYGGGEIRQVPVSIGGTSWKPEMPDQAVVLSDIETLVKQKNPLEAALDLFCYVCRSQIFIDRNGRTGRVLLAKKMLERDYPAFVITKESRTDYMRLLAECDTTGLANMFQALTNDEKKRMEKVGIRVSAALVKDGGICYSEPL